MFEHHRQPLLPRTAYYRRLARYTISGFMIILVSLLIGMIGYHTLESQPWIDAFVNASMLLGGMGPVGELHTPAGKIFAGCYALYSGLVFLLSAGVMFAPAVHRLFHRFHLDLEGDQSNAGDA
jgi:hypothetical protein